MLKQARGTEHLELEEEERHKVVPATETQPIPATNGARFQSAVPSIVNMRKDLTAHHAISLSLCDSLLSVAVSLSLQSKSSNRRRNARVQNTGAAKWNAPFHLRG